MGFYEIERLSPVTGLSKERGVGQWGVVTCSGRWWAVQWWVKVDSDAFWWVVLSDCWMTYWPP